MLLDDIAAWGPEKVERIRRSSYPPFLWRVAVFDEFVYVIQCPSEEWLISATRRRWLRMEDVQFPIVRWDASFDAGRRLTSAWVRLVGFPYRLWSWEEFNRILSPFGAVVLELDPATRSRYDYRFARIRIGIGDISALPTQHNLTYRAPNGFVSTFDIDFTIETAKTEHVNAWRGRLNGRPFPNGTHFGVIPPPPAIPAPHLPTGSTTVSEQPNDVVESLISGDHPMAEAPSAFPSPHNSRSSASAPLVLRGVAQTGPSPNLLSPLPRRRGGIVIGEEPTRPILGDSPPPKSQGKGKAPVTCKPPYPEVNDYDSDESDEDSFQRALNAINNMHRGAGSTSGVSTHNHHPPPPPHHPTQMLLPNLLPITQPLITSHLSIPVLLLHLSHLQRNHFLNLIVIVNLSKIS